MVRNDTFRCMRLNGQCTVQMAGLGRDEIGVRSIVEVTRKDPFDSAKCLMLGVEQVPDLYASVQYTWNDKTQKENPSMTVTVYWHKQTNVQGAFVTYRRDKGEKPYKVCTYPSFINMPKKYAEIAYYIGDIVNKF